MGRAAQPAGGPLSLAADSRAAELADPWVTPDVGTLEVEKAVVRVLAADISSPVPMAFSSLTQRRTCLVEIHAGGLVGLGESWVNYPSWAWAERVATISEGIAPLLVGTDVSKPPEVHARLIEQLAALGRQWGAPGPIWQAISGADAAMWDLLGKAAGVPVAQLLSPRPRASVPAYASGVGPDLVEPLTERAAQAGFTALKVKVGFGLERDISTLQRVRDVAGEGMRVFADANQAWSLSEAAHMCRVLQDYGVQWCEEPVDDNDVSELEALHEVTGMPLATGENVYSIPAFERYMRSPAISVIQPDVAKNGGITTAAHVVRRAAATATSVSPHCYSGALTLAATLQLAAADEVVEWVELDIRDNPLRTDVTSVEFAVDNGRLRVPDGAGLGLELDEERLGYYSHRL